MQEIEEFSGPFFVLGAPAVGKRSLLTALSPTGEIIATDKRYPVEITSTLLIEDIQQLPQRPFGIVLVYSAEDQQSLVFIRELLPRLPETQVNFLIGTHRDSLGRAVSLNDVKEFKKDNALIWFELDVYNTQEVDILRKQLFIRSVFAVRSLVEVDAPIPVKNRLNAVNCRELCLVGDEIVQQPQSVNSSVDFAQQAEYVQRGAAPAEQDNEESYSYYYTESEENTESTAVQQLTVSPKTRQFVAVPAKKSSSTLDMLGSPIPAQGRMAAAAGRGNSLAANPGDSLQNSLVNNPLRSRGSRLHKTGGAAPKAAPKAVLKTAGSFAGSTFGSDRMLNTSLQSGNRSRLAPTYQPKMTKSYKPVKASEDKINNFSAKCTLDPNVSNNYWERSLCPTRTRIDYDVARPPKMPRLNGEESKYPHGVSEYGEALTKALSERQPPNGTRGPGTQLPELQPLELEIEVGDRTLNLTARRTDNAYEVAKAFCAQAGIEQHTKKVALLILARQKELAESEKAAKIDEKLSKMKRYRFQEPVFQNPVMRQILFKFELTVAGRTITVAWREGDVEKDVARNVLKTLSLRPDEYFAFVLEKINEVVSLWRMQVEEEEDEENGEFDGAHDAVEAY